ncbi:hypothetical protein [Sphingobacterium sp. BIGb0116]|uniref:hypothetical protein n=1 Tax=Sphingobacterium sp. BIGb0116 TaxID=2940619 RepID=UPI002167A6E1|nr:hypothetical protein [Sphingobacterium sp. BIGb0116]MCS4165189.1 hypothetical protein [Sphingobacterium sp. BIGb0116]
MSAQDKVWQSVNTQKSTVHAKAKAQQQKAATRLKQLKAWGSDSNYRHAIYVGGRLHTTGWSGQVHYHFNKKPKDESFIRLQVAEIRHEKEVRQQRQDTAYRGLTAYRPYIFGKQYKVYTTQLGYGRQWTIVPSILQGNISLNASLEAGLSLTMLKPVYLNLLRYDAQQQAYASSEAYTAENQELFLSRNRILGADKWSKGLNELRCIPGIFISPSVIFSPDRPSGFVQQFQIGAQLACYTKTIPVLLQQKNTFWQASCFVGISLGKRW